MVCEVCGKPATLRMIDTKDREQTPEEKASDPDREYRYIEQNGPKHKFCDEHKRNSTHTCSDGCVVDAKTGEVLVEPKEAV